MFDGVLDIEFSARQQNKKKVGDFIPDFNLNATELYFIGRTVTK